MKSKTENLIYIYTQNSIIRGESVKSTTLPILHLSFSPPFKAPNPPSSPSPVETHGSIIRAKRCSHLCRGAGTSANIGSRQRSVASQREKRQIRSLNTYRGQASTFQPKTPPAAAAGDKCCAEQRGGSLSLVVPQGLFRVEQPCRPSKGEELLPRQGGGREGGGLRTRQPSGSDLDQPLCEISSGPRLSATVYNLHPPLPSSLTPLSPFSKRVHIYVCVCGRACA